MPPRLKIKGTKTHPNNSILNRETLGMIPEIRLKRMAMPVYMPKIKN